MSDDKTKAGSPDNKRINVHQDYELRDWAAHFGVSKDQIKNAVDAVGTSADAVRKYLKK